MGSDAADCHRQRRWRERRYVTYRRLSMTQKDPLQICPGTQALHAMLDAGFIRPEDLTDDQRADLIRLVSLIDKQAREDVQAAFRLGMKVVSKPSPKSAKV